MFMDLGAILPQVRAGKLRALGVAGERRNALLPEVPTVREQVPGFHSIFWAGLVGPPGTPAAVVNRFSSAIAEVTRLPEVAKRLTELSFEPGEASPAEMGQFMKQERERWGTVIRAIGATAE